MIFFDRMFMFFIYLLSGYFFGVILGFDRFLYNDDFIL